MNILQEILKHKKEELQTVKADIPLSELKSKIEDMGSVRSFKDAIKREQGEHVRLIAELKKASPSKGSYEKTSVFPKSYPFTIKKKSPPYPFSLKNAILPAALPI